MMEGATMTLSQIPTKDLVDELRCMEGVDTTVAAPYEDAAVQVNGPAIILVVTD